MSENFKGLINVVESSDIFIFIITNRLTHVVLSKYPYKDVFMIWIYMRGKE